MVDYEVASMLDAKLFHAPGRALRTVGWMEDNSDLDSLGDRAPLTDGHLVWMQAQNLKLLSVHQVV